MNKHNYTDSKLIRDQALNGPCKNAFVEKIENNTSLHMEDIEIHQYFMSSNNGLIAWIQLDAPIVERIMRETSRIPAKIFKTVPFIPEIARGCKKAIDAVLLQYKRTIDDSLCYLIKNDVDDVKVLLKRYSEYDYLPYREIELKHLGKLPGFSTITKDDRVNQDLVNQVENPEDFRIQRKRKQRNSPKKLSQSQININITRFLDGLSLKIRKKKQKESLNPMMRKSQMPETVKVYRWKQQKTDKKPQL